MTKLVFDMDGTVADLYNVENWLADLLAENTRPYDIAEPMYNMVELADLLNTLKTKGYTVAIVSWTAKNGRKEYNKAVRKAKIAWLKRYNFPVDEIHIVKYGTKKQTCIKADNAILFDDDERVRNTWTKGTTVNANFSIIPFLTKLAEG